MRLGNANGAILLIILGIVFFIISLFLLFDDGIGGTIGLGWKWIFTMGAGVILAFAGIRNLIFQYRLSKLSE